MNLYHDLLLFLPESMTLLGALVAFVLSLANAPAERTWVASLFFALLGFGAACISLNQSGEPFAPGIYRVDLFSQLIKVGLALGLLWVLALCRKPTTIRPSTRIDVPFFLSLSTVGMMMVVSATELLTFYVSLELSAYGMYIAVALHRDQSATGAEGAAKYVLFGAVSSAITLYGLSLIFGLFGTTFMADIASQAATITSPLFYVAVLLVLAGLLFKVALFPFHFWAPNAYQSAPHQLVTFIASASKLAAVGILGRILSLASADPKSLVEIIFVLSLLSMTIGNLAAIVQKDLKRLLAFSTAAHAGYLMVGFIAFSQTGVAATLFYGFVYLFTAFAAFLVVCAMGDDGSNPTLESIAGLHKRSPMLAFILLIAMFGLAGIPPTGGFAGKWFLFSAALEAGHFNLVLLAAINSTIALYYYLIVIREAYLRAPKDDIPLVLSGPYRVAGLSALALLLFVGVYPGPLWDLCHRAAALLITR